MFGHSSDPVLPAVPSCAQSGLHLLHFGSIFLLVHVAVQDHFAAAALALSCWTGTTLVLPAVSRGTQ